MIERLINTIKDEITYIEEDLLYYEESDTAFTKEYTDTVKARKILVKTLKKLKKLEVHSK